MKAKLSLLTVKTRADYSVDGAPKPSDRQAKDIAIWLYYQKLVGTAAMDRDADEVAEIADGVASDFDSEFPNSPLDFDRNIRPELEEQILAGLT